MGFNDVKLSVCKLITSTVHVCVDKGDFKEHVYNI